MVGSGEAEDDSVGLVAGAVFALPELDESAGPVGKLPGMF
jgi:hypothetical protein